MSEISDIKSIIPTYYVLITDKLNRIYDAWDSQNIPLALFRTLKLIPFLPRKLKAALKEDKERIEQSLKNASLTKGYDADSAKERSMYNINKVAQKEFEPLLDKVTDLLDEANLLTQHYGIPTRKSTIQNIGKSLQ